MKSSEMADDEKEDKSVPSKFASPPDQLSMLQNQASKPKQLDHNLLNVELENIQIQNSSVVSARFGGGQLPDQQPSNSNQKGLADPNSQ